MMDISLRSATLNDISTILEILNNGTRNKIRRGDLAWGMTDHNPEAIRTMVANGLFYLAFDGTTPVGTCALARQDDSMWGKQPPDASYIQRFAVAAGYSGQNVGGQILDLIVDELTQNGRHYLRIAVPSGNPKLRAYYESHGFNRADHKVAQTIHPVYPATYYERPAQGDAQHTITAKKESFFAKLRRTNPFRESE